MTTIIISFCCYNAMSWFCMYKVLLQVYKVVSHVYIFISYVWNVFAWAILRITNQPWVFLFVLHSCIVSISWNCCIIHFVKNSLGSVLVQLGSVILLCTHIFYWTFSNKICFHLTLFYSKWECSSIIFIGFRVALLLWVSIYVDVILLPILDPN